jgi:hypothetical protein
MMAAFTRRQTLVGAADTVAAAALPARVMAAPLKKFMCIGITWDGPPPASKPSSGGKIACGSGCAMSGRASDPSLIRLRACLAAAIVRWLKRILRARPCGSWLHRKN